MQNIVDIVVNPDELQEVYTYRKGIKLVLKSGEWYWIPRGIPYGQLIRKFTEFKVREVIDLIKKRQWHVVNKKILETLRSREEPIILRRDVVSREIFAVVSPKFVHVDHTVVFNAVRTTLEELNVEIIREIKYEKDYDAEAIFWLKKQLPGLDAGLRVTNSIRATWAINIYAAYRIIQCENILYNPRALFAKVVHVGEFKQVLLKIPDAVKRALQYIDAVVPLINSAKQLRLSYEMIKTIFDTFSRKYPKHIIDRLRTRLYDEEPTLFGISQAFSWVASHYPRLTDNYRLELAKDAFRILKVPQEKQELLAAPTTQ